MRVLLTGVGTRGDVQPVVALAAEMRRRGHDVRLCVPPNFIDWVGGLGFTATPIGIAMRQHALDHGVAARAAAIAGTVAVDGTAVAADLIERASA